MMSVLNCRATHSGPAICFFILSLLTANIALAGSFSVSPVRVDLSGQERVVALRVRNGGTEPTAVQAELLTWHQQDGEEIHEPSREVLVTPPIFTVPAGETQVIRVGLRRAPDQHKELSYRLFLQELPPPIPEGFQGLRVVTRMSLPVFVAPASGRASPELTWRARRGSEGELVIAANNEGNGHSQVTRLHLELDDGRELNHSGNTYVLPGAERQWLIAPEGDPIAPGTNLALTVSLNGKDITTNLQVE